MSECYLQPPASSSGARLFQTPLSQNYTVVIKLRALAHGVFTPLPVRMLRLTPSFELWRKTFSHPSQLECCFWPQASSSGARLSHTLVSQNATFGFKLRALAHIFSHPLYQNFAFNLNLRALALSHPSQSDAITFLMLRALAHDFFTPLSARILLLASRLEL